MKTRCCFTCLEFQTTKLLHFNNNKCSKYFLSYQICFFFFLKNNFYGMLLGWIRMLAFGTVDSGSSPKYGRIRNTVKKSQMITVLLYLNYGFGYTYTYMQRMISLMQWLYILLFTIYFHNIHINTHCHYTKGSLVCMYVCNFLFFLFMFM